MLSAPEEENSPRPWPGCVLSVLGGVARGRLPALLVGQGSPQTANRWLAARTAQAGAELVPKHRKLQVSSSAPSRFSSTRIHGGRKRLHTECLHPCPALLLSALSSARMAQRAPGLLATPPGLVLTSTRLYPSKAARSKHNLRHKAGLEELRRPQSFLFLMPAQRLPAHCEADTRAGCWDSPRAACGSRNTAELRAGCCTNSQGLGCLAALGPEPSHPRQLCWLEHAVVSTTT